MEEYQKIDYINVKGLCPELKSFIYFCPELYNFFTENKDSYKKPFQLQTAIENLNNIEMVIRNSKDKNLSSYLYEMLFGANICLYLTYYEKNLGFNEGFKQVKDLYQNVVRRFLEFPVICTRGFLAQELLEPILRWNHQKEWIAGELEKLKRAIFILSYLTGEIMEFLLKTLLVVSCEVFSEEDLVQEIKRVGNDLITKYNEKLETKSVMMVSEKMMDKYKVPKQNDNRIYVYYQKAYCQKYKQLLYYNNLWKAIKQDK